MKRLKVVAAALLLAAMSPASAQSWPSKPIRYIVNFAPGGTADILGRMVSAKRSFLAPEVPTMQEAGLAGYDISSWQAMFAPAGLPKDIHERLYAETVKALRAPDVAKRLHDLGLDVGGMRPEELAAYIRADIPKLAKVVKDSGAKVD